MRPLPSTSNSPTRIACSVSSVIEPLGMFAAIGCSGTGVLQIGDCAEAGLDGFAVQRLRRHAQRITEGQAIETRRGHG